MKQAIVTKTHRCSQAESILRAIIIGGHMNDPGEMVELAFDLAGRFERLAIATGQMEIIETTFNKESQHDHESKEEKATAAQRVQADPH